MLLEARAAAARLPGVGAARCQYSTTARVGASGQYALVLAFWPCFCSMLLLAVASVLLLAVSLRQTVLALLKLAMRLCKRA